MPRVRLITTELARTIISLKRVPPSCCLLPLAVLFSLVPLWCGLLEWIAMGEHVDRCTIATVLLCIASVLLLFLADPGGPIRGGKGSHMASLKEAPPVASEAAPWTNGPRGAVTNRMERIGLFYADVEDQDGVRAPSLPGDTFALLSGISIAGYLTMCRWIETHDPDAALALAPAVGAFLSAIPTAAWGIIFRPDETASLISGPGWGVVCALMVLTGLAETVEDVASGAATKYISATQVSAHASCRCVQVSTKKQAGTAVLPRSSPRC